MSETQYRVGTCTQCDERIWLTPSGACSRGHGLGSVTLVEVVPAPPTPLPATVYCRSCGAPLFETVPACRGCGTPQGATSADAASAGNAGSYAGGDGGPSSGFGSNGKTYQIGSSKVALNASYFPKLTSAPDLSYEEPYYRDEFTRMYESGETYRGQFNWAALIFGPFWALARDLPMVGLGWLVASIIISTLTSGTLWPLTLAYNIYFGIKANYLRYTAKFKGVEAFAE